MTRLYPKETTHHNPAADTMTAAARLATALANMAEQMVKLVQQVTNPMAVVDTGPAERSQAEYLGAFETWAKETAQADIPDEVKARVREQVEKTNGLSREMAEHLRRTVAPPAAVEPAGPEYHDETIRMAVPELGPVLAANNIPWGFHNVPRADPAHSNPSPETSVLVFQLPNHNLTADVVELFESVVGRKLGRKAWTLKGSNDPAGAAPADLRKRPDIFGVSRMEPVLKTVADLRAKQGRVEETTTMVHNIPPTFEQRPEKFPPLPPVAPG